MFHLRPMRARAERRYGTRLTGGMLHCGLLWCAAISAAHAAPEIEFAAPCIPTPVGVGPSDLAVGDLNEDGFEDAVTANSEGGTISVLLGTGDGRFRERYDLRVPGVTKVAIAKIDADNHPDVLCLHSRVVTLFHGDGNGLLQPVSDIGQAGFDLQTGDLNRDGAVDLIFPETVRLGHGDGTFGEAMPLGGLARYVAAGDLDKDGNLDLVTSEYSQTVVYLGRGDGTFSNGPPLDFLGTNILVRLGDVTGDSNLDLVCGSMRVLPGRGDGGFAPPVSTLVHGAPQVFWLAEIDGDPRIDVVAGTAAGDVVSLRGTSDGSFVAPTQCRTGNGPVAIRTADFNGDGHTDVVVANVESYTVTVLLGNGDGTLGKDFRVPVGQGPTGVAAGDLNHDGRAEFVTSNLGPYVSVLSFAAGTLTPARTDLPLGGSSTFVIVQDLDGDSYDDILALRGWGAPDAACVFKNHAGTGFDSRIDYPMGGGPVDAQTPDLNGDGIRDLLVLCSGSETIVRRYGDGQGGFLPPIGFPAAEYSSSCLGAADVDHDSNTDLFIGSECSLAFRHGVPVGLFEPPVSQDARCSPRDIEFADLNEDGWLDLILASSTVNTVSVLIANPGGSFQPEQILPVGAGPTALVAADLDRDGHLDIATANVFERSVTVLRGHGDGTFERKRSYGAGGWPTDLAVGDINGDSWPDLAVSNRASGDVSVLLNRGGTTPLAIERFEHAVVADAVHISWRLGIDAAAVEAIHVWTGTQAGDAGAVELASLTGDCTAFVDHPLERGARDPWYELRVELHGGTAVRSERLQLALAPPPAKFTLDAPRVSRAGEQILFPYHTSIAAGELALTVYDVRGRRLWRVRESTTAPGSHAIRWNLRDTRLAGGRYFVRAQFDGVERTRSFALPGTP